jgi:aminoglycoside phosphotransferase family enzyme/predicted kinase
VIIEDQSAVIAFLSAPAAYGLVEPIEVIRTHISEVFLAGGRAYKMKRAVRLPYVDFSTIELRLEACQDEVSLNSLTAPDLYLGIRRITRDSDGRLVLDGAGDLVEVVVEMVRFEQEALFDRMATDGRLTLPLLTATARAIAGFHRSAPVISSGTGSNNMANVLAINEAGFRTSQIFDADEVSRITALFRHRLEEHAQILDRRSEAGRIRRCHGDLHLRNICLFEGKPRLFDCIEFNLQIASTDVLYDLAFLLMDLWHRGDRMRANWVMNRYLDETQEEDGFCLLPFFMATRAAVRAHVTATQASEAEGAAASALAAEARSYYELALSLLQKAPARLVAIGGLSGSGKSSLADALASVVGAAPGARVLESDRIRKALHDVPAETRLPPAAYRPEVSQKVYAEMAWRAAVILGQGGCAVVDAVFERHDERRKVERTADEAGVPFLGAWLEAEPLLLWERVSSRSGGASDANTEVLAQQLERRPRDIDWLHLDAGRAIDENVALLLSLTC